VIKTEVENLVALFLKVIAKHKFFRQQKLNSFFHLHVHVLPVFLSPLPFPIRRIVRSTFDMNKCKDNNSFSFLVPVP